MSDAEIEKRLAELGAELVSLRIQRDQVLERYGGDPDVLESHMHLLELESVVNEAIDPLDDEEV